MDLKTQGKILVVGAIMAYIIMLLMYAIAVNAGVKMSASVPLTKDNCLTTCQAKCQ